MKKRKTALHILIMAAIIALVPAAGQIHESGSITAFAEEKNSSEDLPQPGEKIHGFTVEELAYSQELSSDRMTFRHDRSGATVLFIVNDDQNRSFDIAYRTYSEDESDINHMLEHLVVASSEKYKGKDVFFDILNTSYNTGMNAFTYITNTQYIASSTSVEQLRKIMDVYLSCMTEPVAISDENFFKREGVRYELYDEQGPIKLAGTVLGEDRKKLTSITDSSWANVMDALYPGQQASNINTFAVMNYDLASYDKVKKAYEKYYRFDNSLITIYGDIDYQDMLNFLDKEYLSRYSDTGSDFSEIRNEKELSGHVETVNMLPAYNDSIVEGGSRIDYAVSMYNRTWEERISADIFMEILGESSSPLSKRLAEEGIRGNLNCGSIMDAVKPYLSIALTNTDLSEKGRFKSATDEILQEISRNGLDPQYLETSLKQKKLRDTINNDSGSRGFDLSETESIYWADTGKTDYHDKYAEVLKNIEADENQKIIKEVASFMLNPGRSALVATIPQPGLAEEILEGIDEQLLALKLSMSGEQIEEMIRQTEEFSIWNDSQSETVRVSIDIKDLPEPEKTQKPDIEKQGSVTWYLYPSDVREMGFFSMAADISNLEKEELFYHSMYKLFAGRLETDNYEAGELENMMNSYLSMKLYEYSYAARQGEATPSARLSLEWTGLNEDFENTLELYIEIMKRTRFEDRQAVISILEQKLPLYDPSRYYEPIDLAAELSMSQVNKSVALREYFQEQQYYEFLKAELDRLKNDEKYIFELDRKMRSIAEKALRKDNMIFMITSEPEKIPQMKKSAYEKISTLPSTPGGKNASLDDVFIMPRKTAVITNAGDQANIMALNLRELPQFDGRYLPFMYHISNGHLIPEIRFKNGAYSTDSYYNKHTGALMLWSAYDPNISETYEVFIDIPDFLRNSEITQQELDSYILAIYGEMTSPVSQRDAAFKRFNNLMDGLDPDFEYETLRQMKNAKAEDKDKAAEMLEAALADATSVTVGNEKTIRENAQIFDEIWDFRN